jgi:hypothetical protein
VVASSPEVWYTRQESMPVNFMLAVGFGVFLLLEPRPLRLLPPEEAETLLRWQEEPRAGGDGIRTGPSDAMTDRL